MQIYLGYFHNNIGSLIEYLGLLRLFFTIPDVGI